MHYDNEVDVFIFQNSQQIYFYLYNAAKAETNDNSHIKKISLVICLIALEFEVEDVIVEIVGFVFGLQVRLKLKSNLYPDLFTFLESLVLESKRKRCIIS